MVRNPAVTVFTRPGANSPGSAALCHSIVRPTACSAMRLFPSSFARNTRERQRQPARLAKVAEWFS